jgi:hypothetical protein
MDKGTGGKSCRSVLHYPRLRLTCVQFLEGHAHEVVGLEELLAEGGVAAAHPRQGMGAQSDELSGGVGGGGGGPHHLDERVWYSWGRSKAG